jgi:hypothetical protein
MGVPSDNTVVFLLSELRTGSTWLSYVLGSHSRAVHLGEFCRPFTIPGHTACRRCEAKGERQCEYLYGITAIAKEHAFDFAFARFRQPILIDASKSLAWLATFAGADRYRVKAVHLLRDPRAWYASERRRTEMSVGDAMTRWVATNQTIAAALRDLAVPYLTQWYDALCTCPDVHFPALCDFIGMPFELRALRYWEKEHHGLGGNGAALNNLTGLPRAQVLTGDDEYYIQRLQKHFYDSRWLVQLHDLERRAIEEAENVNALLFQYGQSFTQLDNSIEDWRARGGSLI